MTLATCAHAHAGFLQSAGWAPHSPDVLQMADGIFGSAFPGGEGKAAAGDVVYFLVNRKGSARQAPQLDISALPATHKFYNCYGGVELKPTAKKELEFTIDGNGYGCVFATATSATLDEVGGPTAAELRSEAPPVPADLTALLKTMYQLTQTPLSTFSPTFHYLNQTMVGADERTTPLRSKSSAGASETYVPGGDFHFVAEGVELEGSHDTGVDVQYVTTPANGHPASHQHCIQLAAAGTQTHH